MDGKFFEARFFQLDFTVTNYNIADIFQAYYFFPQQTEKKMNSKSITFLSSQIFF